MDLLLPYLPPVYAFTGCVLCLSTPKSVRLESSAGPDTSAATITRPHLQCVF